jgi:hypothetical protein
VFSKINKINIVLTLILLFSYNVNSLTPLQLMDPKESTHINDKHPIDQEAYPAISRIETTKLSNMNDIITTSEEFKQVGSDGFKVYKQDDILNKEILIQLKRSGLEYHIALVTSDLDLSIVIALIRQPNGYSNPHLLYNSFYDFKDPDEDITIIYDSEIESVYLVVYSYYLLLSSTTIEIDTGYHLYSTHTLTSIEVSSEIEDYMPYHLTAEIEDTGSTRREKEEWFLLESIKIPAGSIFELFIISDTYDQIGAVLFNGSTAKDLSSAISSLKEWRGVGQINQYAYAGDIGDGIIYMIFRPDFDLIANLGVFSNRQSIFLANLDVYMSHPHEGEIIYGGRSLINNINYPIPLSILSLTVLALISNKMYRNKLFSK